jgi:hypothetical protein
MAAAKVGAVSINHIMGRDEKLKSRFFGGSEGHSLCLIA